MDWTLLLLLRWDHGWPGYLLSLLFAKEDLKPLTCGSTCVSRGEAKKRDRLSLEFPSGQSERGSWMTFQVFVVWSTERKFLMDGEKSFQREVRK